MPLREFKFCAGPGCPSHLAMTQRHERWGHDTPTAAFVQRLHLVLRGCRKGHAHGCTPPIRESRVDRFSGQESEARADHRLVVVDEHAFPVAAAVTDVVEPDEIAAVAHFLLSDDSGVINGAEIPVYGRA